MKTPVFGTNLLNGPYADTNAADPFRTLSHAKDQDIVDLVDFASFAPAKDILSPLPGPRPDRDVFQFPIDQTARGLAFGAYAAVIRARRRCQRQDRNAGQQCFDPFSKRRFDPA